MVDFASCLNEDINDIVISIACCIEECCLRAKFIDVEWVCAFCNEFFDHFDLVVSRCEENGCLTVGVDFIHIGSML